MTGPKRAPKGSITGALLLRLPAPLLQLIKQRARQAGLSRAEWVRRVVQAAAERPSTERTEHQDD